MGCAITHLCPTPCSAVTRLDEQIEAFEADLEAAGGGEGNKVGGGAPRAEELETLIARHRQHIVRLEQVLRLMENGQARPSCIAGLLGPHNQGGVSISRTKGLSMRLT